VVVSAETYNKVLGIDGNLLKNAPDEVLTQITIPEDKERVATCNAHL